MGWGNNNGNSAMYALPSFSTYAEAKKWYDNTKEIRGSNNIRPLGLRRAAHSMSIVSSQKYIAAKFYQTECVRWMEPVEQLIEGGEQVLTIGVDKWHSSTTAAFINQVLPRGLRATRERMKVRVNGLIVGDEHSMEWRKNAEGVWTVKDIDSYREYTHKLNMPVVNALKKQHKAFRVWLKGVLNLTEGRFNEGEALTSLRVLRGYDNTMAYTLLGNKDPYVKTQFMDLINAADSDPDKYAKWMQAAQWVALTMGVKLWRANTGQVLLTNGAAAFDKVLLALHAEATLIKTPLPLGKVKKDTYAKWV